jgi:phosphatidylinositol glycan class A protein|tara:strand:+ start:1305 stop:1811 length:507 start_codon:yes stop_codon:yes gene_type:complete
MSYESADGAAVDVRVTDPDGRDVYVAKNKARGKAGFTTKIAGDHSACFTRSRPPGGGDDFSSNDGDGVAHRVKLDWKKGVAVNDWNKIAKRGDVADVATDLRRVEADLRGVHQEMMWLRRREEEMRTINEKTNARVAWLCAMSLCACVASGATQYAYLKYHFRAKKMI